MLGSFKSNKLSLRNQCLYSLGVTIRHNRISSPLRNTQAKSLHTEKGERERTQMRRTRPPSFLVRRPTDAKVGARPRRGPSRIDDAMAILYPGRCADWIRTSSEIGSSIIELLFARCRRYNYKGMVGTVIRSRDLWVRRTLKG